MAAEVAKSKNHGAHVPAKDVAPKDVAPKDAAPVKDIAPEAPAPEAPDIAPEAPATPTVSVNPAAPEAPTVPEAPAPDLLRDAIAAKIREGFGELETVMVTLNSERKELADEINSRKANGKNGKIMEVLETELQALDAKAIVAKNTLATIEQRIAAALSHVLHLADPMAVVNPPKVVGTPRVANRVATSTGNGGTAKSTFRARVNGEEVTAATALQSLSNLSWYKTGGQGSDVNNLRSVFAAENAGTSLDSHISNSAGGWKGCTVNNLINGKSYHVELAHADYQG